MTSINTQTTTGATNAISAFSSKPSNETALAAAVSASPVPSTKLTLSEEAVEEDSTPYDPAIGGYDPNMPKTQGPLRILSGEAQMAIRNAEGLEYHTKPTFSADAALMTINREMTSLQHKIEAVKPDLMGKKWDFVLKGDKIEVTGVKLTTDEKQWLENTLNRNKNVLGAVKDFYAAVVKNFEHTEDHPSSFNDVNGKQIYAYGVAEQIDGKLQIKNIMDQITAKYGDNQKNTHPFIRSLDVAQTYLKVTTEATYTRSKADLSDPATAAYMQEHPNYNL